MEDCSHLHDLSHDGSIEFLRESDKAGVKQPHQVMLHEVKHKVKGSLVLPEVDCLLLVSNNLPELDDILVF